MHMSSRLSRPVLDPSWLLWAEGLTSNHVLASLLLYERTCALSRIPRVPGPAYRNTRSGETEAFMLGLSKL